MIDFGKKNLLGVHIDAVDYIAAVTRFIDAGKQSKRLTVTALAVGERWTRGTAGRWRCDPPPNDPPPQPWDWVRDQPRARPGPRADRQARPHELENLQPAKP